MQYTVSGMHLFIVAYFTLNQASNSISHTSYILVHRHLKNIRNCIEGKPLLVSGTCDMKEANTCLVCTLLLLSFSILLYVEAVVKTRTDTQYVAGFKLYFRPNCYVIL